MRDRILKKLADWHTTYPGRMLLTVVILTLIFAALSSQLRITMRWSDLLPSGDRRTIEFNKVIEEFLTATSIIVVVQGEEQRIKQFADDLAPQLLKAELTNPDGTVRKLIQRVDYKTEIDFMKKHGFMLIKEDDLKNMKEVFTDPHLTGLITNINNSMEKEYVGKSESISTREKEDQAVQFLDGIQNLTVRIKETVEGEPVEKGTVEQAAEKLLYGEPYFLSYDKKTLVLNAIPTFSVVDIDILVAGTEMIQHILDQKLADYPDVKAGLTGMVPVSHDEMIYSEQSLGYTTVIAVFAILILLILSLRMWVAPLFAIINLLIGIVWAVGITVLAVGQLNIMTQMMSVILLGLGIDFSIHLISGFTERRAAGDSILLSMEETFLKSGKGIITGGLTTAFAFLTMIISNSRGMKEMGIVTGLGLLAILVATFFILPIFLVYRERRIDRKHQRTNPGKERVQRDISFLFLGRAGRWLSQKWRFTLTASLILTAFFSWLASQITFDQNYMNIEPKGLVSITLQDTVLNAFDLSMDYALVITDNVNESRQLAEQYREIASVAMAEDISLYLPSLQQQQRQSPHIREIRRKMQSAIVHPKFMENDLPRLIHEIKRLKMNVMEMQDMAYLGGQDKVDTKCKKIVGDPDQPESTNMISELTNLLHHMILTDKTDSVIQRLTVFQTYFLPYFQKSVIEMCATESITMADLPPSILDRYTNKTNDQFLITVYPSGNIWQDADFLNRFANDLENVSNRATGMPPVFRALIEIIGKDGQNALILTVVIIFLLLWADFRNPKHALISMIPLAGGFLWMIGLMHLTGQQFTVLNIMGLPMILGIGIDDGVHIVHRWLVEGKGNIRRVFASTGKAILLTSLTTMLAFGSLIFSIYRGFGQLGSALFVGVAACFLTTVLILSGIMGFFERKR